MFDQKNEISKAPETLVQHKDLMQGTPSTRWAPLDAKGGGGNEEEWEENKTI